MLLDYQTLQYQKTPVAPKYPRIAKRRGVEGTVILMLMINRRGIVDNALIDRSSGYSVLDKAAIKAATQWRFMPIIKAGKSKLAQARVPVRFSLLGDG